MIDRPDVVTPAALRRALNRKALADARHRDALGAHLDVAETDLLAIQHLARAGELTTTRLGALLGLTSGGTTALVQRLERAGYLQRVPHPTDRRSTLLRLSPEIERRADELMGPLVDEVDRLASQLTTDERRAVDAFLNRVAEASERHADDLLRTAHEQRHDPVVSPVPSLWA
jgi:DNA-binding MarR family transcriptional regulator